MYQRCDFAQKRPPRNLARAQRGEQRRAHQAVDEGQAAPLQFAHKAGAWEPVGGSFAYSMRTRAGEPFSAPSSIEVKREAFADPLSMAGRCVLARAQ